MGKYDPLSHYLKAASKDVIEASFEQVEKILGFQLPQSAYRHQAWWANETHGSHSHARSWQDAGWETRQVNTERRRVRFERRRALKLESSPDLPTTPANDASLWAQAEEVTGIRDRKELIRSALQALIQREAGRHLAAMGGTIPDIKAPPRRRLSW